MTPFVYKKGNSLLHNLDPRVKLIIISFISISLIKAIFPGLIIIFILVIFMISNCRIGISNSFNNIKYFLILLVFIFISRAVTTTGEPLFSILDIHVSINGIIDGALISLRFLIILLLGMIFSHTTNPSSIKCAAEWFLKPIPFIKEKKTALMIGLSIRFFPLIIEKAKQVSDAQKARCSANQRNPIKKIIQLILPILKKTFQTADNLALAMESRCFSEDRTDPEFDKSGYEGISLILTALVVAIIIIF